MALQKAGHKVTFKTKTSACSCSRSKSQLRSQASLKTPAHKDSWPSSHATRRARNSSTDWREAIAADASSVVLLVQCLGARAIPDRVLGRPEVAREPAARPEACRAIRRGKIHLGPGVRARELPRGGVQRLVSAGGRKPEPSRVVRVRTQVRASTGPSTVQLDVVIAPRSVLQAPRQAAQVLGAPALDAGGLARRDPAAPAEELDALGAVVFHNEALDPHAPDTGLLPSHCLLHPGRGQVAMLAKRAVPRSPAEGGRRGATSSAAAAKAGAAIKLHATATAATTPPNEHRCDMAVA
eukprot:CAMPEP_0203875506 /NCGR_PEP_ID=MMETSP0359-20131031/20848_1 /ASSEMBLY_ACC=CAM_ASM_000338 /TAXON_ID=268821 /ORGANISM="Scrippsiella Hangoei, Strain SHTV-5" /LENGTH=295 /DNA_ID=CAMNT_0050794315 /DNA_START=92 /DNA_END=979 /DNA_ORIENTATION=+